MEAAQESHLFINKIKVGTSYEDAFDLDIFKLIDITPEDTDEYQRLKILAKANPSRKVELRGVSTYRASYKKSGGFNKYGRIRVQAFEDEINDFNTWPEDKKRDYLAYAEGFAFLRSESEKNEELKKFYVSYLKCYFMHRKRFLIIEPDLITGLRSFDFAMAENQSANKLNFGEWGNMFIYMKLIVEPLEAYKTTYFDPKVGMHFFHAITRNRVSDTYTILTYSEFKEPFNNSERNYLQTSLIELERKFKNGFFSESKYRMLKKLLMDLMKNSEPN